MRPIFAFLISPVPAIIVMLALGFRLKGEAGLSQYLLACIPVYLLLLGLQLIVAAPLRWYFARRGRQSVWIDSVLGALAFFVPGVIYISSVRASMIDLALRLAIMLILGAVAGLTYGLLRLRDRRVSLQPTATDLAARFD